MHEDGAVGVKADAAVGVGTGCPILEVAFDRAAHMRELAADLVMPSGEEFDFEQMVAVGILNQTVTEFCQLGFMGAGLYDIAFILLIKHLINITKSP